MASSLVRISVLLMLLALFSVSLISGTPLRTQEVQNSAAGQGDTNVVGVSQISGTPLETPKVQDTDAGHVDTDVAHKRSKRDMIAILEVLAVLWDAYGRR